MASVNNIISQTKRSDLKPILFKYAADGWYLFPVNKDKQPYEKGGFHNATEIQQRILEYLKKYPNSNWAGWFHHQFIIDVDKRNGGLESLPKFEAKYGKLPQTRTHRSGGGGYHYIYKQPPGHAISKADPITSEYPGIDLQADRSYIVLPPSVTEAAYEVIDDSPIIEAPEWLVNFVLNCKKIEPIKEAANIAAGQKIPMGQNDKYLTKMAGVYRNKGDNPEQILAKLEIDVLNCEQDPKRPYTKASLKRIADSVSRYEPGTPIPQQNPIKRAFNWIDEQQSHAQLMEKDLPPISFLVDQMLVKPGLSVLGGKKKSGKSYLALDAAIAISQGLPFLGLNTKKAKVVYLAIEDGERRIKQRLLQKKAPKNLDIIYFYKWPALNTDEGRKAFVDMIKGIKPEFIAIDTLASSKNKLVDENDNNAMADFINWIHSLCIAYDLSIMIVAHHGKKSTGEPGFDIRGASATPGATDCNMGLYKKDGFSDLVIEGRDIPSLELSIQWNDFVWQLKGNAYELRRDAAEDKVLEAILTLGNNCTARQIATYSNLSRGTVQSHLERMRGLNHKVDFKTEIIKNVPHIFYFIPGMLNTQSPNQPQHPNRQPVGDDKRQPQQGINESKTGDISNPVGAVGHFRGLASNNGNEPDDDDGYAESLMNEVPENEAQ